MKPGGGQNGWLQKFVSSAASLFLPAVNAGDVLVGTGPGVMGTVPGGIRERLTAHRTINVTASPTAIQTAIDTVLQTLDPNKYIVTIQCADGTYSGGAAPVAKLDAPVPGSVLQFATYPSGDETSIIIKGNAADRTAVVLTSAAAATIIATNGACIAVQDCTITNTIGDGLNAAGGFIFFGNCILGATGASKLSAVHSGVIEPYSDFALKDNSLSIYNVSTGGSIWMGGRTITLLNSFTVTQTAIATSSGDIAHLSCTYAGAFTITGKKFTINGGVIDVDFGSTDITLLPGTLPGTITTGWYGTRPISTAKHEISANLLATAAPLAGTLLHLVGADNALVGTTIDSYGAGGGAFMQLRSASGTGAVPTALVINQGFASYTGAGWHSGGAFGATQASIGYFAAEAWTNTARGSYQSFYTTPIGATAVGEALRINADKMLRAFGYAGGNLVTDGSGNISASSGSILPQGRLTLTTNTPVMTASVTAGATVYYTPAVGSIIPVYDGTAFIPKSFTELSQATTDNTKSPAAVATGNAYDVFVWLDGVTLRATRGPTWSSGTAGSNIVRGTGAGSTELVRVGGVLLNANAITNGPAAQRGTYVGTIYSDQSNAISFIFGTNAAGGGASVLGVWNCYNRVTVTSRVGDTNASWTFSSATPTALDVGGTGSGLNNRFTFVSGLAEDSAEVSLAGSVASAAAAGASGYIGFTLDATNLTDRQLGCYSATAATTVNYGSISGTYAPQLGLHFLQATQKGDGTTTTTIFSSAGAQKFEMRLRM